MSILTQYQWLENQLHSLIGPVKFSSEINLRLERMDHLLGLMGNPHHSFRGIHIGGTAGKGSTSTMIASMLQAGGYRVGLHTSPHLQILNERHQINGEIVSTTRLIEAYKQMMPAIEEVTKSSPFGHPSYFEAQVALSFLIFQMEEVEFGVVEVGLGGTRDATNVLPAEVAVITNVGLDHTEILGDTVVEIAQDKAGIIKPGQRVVTGVHQPDVYRVIAGRCAQEDAELWMLGLDFDVIADGDYIITYGGEEIDDVQFSMAGRFQAKNGAVAVAAVKSLEGVNLTHDQIRAGLLNAKLPGRVEMLQENPLVVLDGAHNADKIEGTADIFADYRNGKRVITILGLKAGKTAADILPPVIELTDKLILTTFLPKGLWKSEDPEELATLSRKIDPSLDVVVIPHPEAAREAALKEARPEDVVWITGSLYLAGDMRTYWYPIETLLENLESD